MDGPNWNIFIYILQKLQNMQPIRLMEDSQTRWQIVPLDGGQKIGAG